MAQPIDWLGQFIEDEIRAVIAWKQASNRDQQGNSEQDNRFSDDGSNFRSMVAPSTLSHTYKLQITKIITTEDPVALYITDGFTRVKAKLSEGATAVLEVGLGEEVGIDMKGDVISLREVTVESTPYGPLDGLIQLAIADLEYLFHLRKSLGQPTPIEDRPEAGQLIEEITNLRNNQYPPGKPSSPRSVRVNLAENDTPKSQRSLGLSQVSSPVINRSPGTQGALATQIPTRRKPEEPTLAKDGFEMNEGVNLSRPVAPGIRDTNIKSSQSPVVENSTGAKLLSLLKKRKPETPLEKAGAKRPASRPTINASHQNQVSGPEVNTQLVPPLPITTQVEQHPPSKEAEQHSHPKERKRHHKPHKLSQAQRKLLDKSSSWIPSLPAQRFPHPNVPIDLLKRWNGEAELNAKNTTMPKSSGGNVEPSLALERPETGNNVDTNTAASSSPESSSDDEIPEEDWPPSQPQDKPRLPPDSSAGNNSRPSTAVNPEVISSDSSEGIESGRRAGQGHLQKRPPDSSGASVKTPSPRHNKPVSKSPTSARPSAMTRSPSQVRDSLDGNSSRPTTTESRPGDSRLGLLEATFMKPSPRPIKRPHESPGSTNRSIIKGTQLGVNDNEEMEMEVPRSLDEDPAVRHRRRRSEHFRAAQRREWIKNNYVPNSSKQGGFPKSYSAYRKAYPKDELKLSEFASAIEDVYPNATEDPPFDGEVELSSPKPAQNVVMPTSSQLQPASIADTGGAVETPPTIANKSAITSTPPSASKRRSLPWKAGVADMWTPIRSTQIARAPPASALAHFPSSAPHALPPRSTYESQNVISKQPDIATSIPPRLSQNAEYDSSKTSTHSTPQSSSHAVTHTATPAAHNNIIAHPPRLVLQKTTTPPPAKHSHQDKSFNAMTTSKYSQQRSEPFIRNEDSVGDNAEDTEASLSKFQEFVRRWKNIQPRGAFAVEERPADRKEGSARKARLDVLGWEL